jgi:hypothetical protein
LHIVTKPEYIFILSVKLFTSTNETSGDFPAIYVVSNGYNIEENETAKGKKKN